MSDELKSVAVKGDVQAALEAARLGQVTTIPQDEAHSYVVLVDSDGAQSLQVPPDHPSNEVPRALKTGTRFRVLSELVDFCDNHGANVKLFVAPGRAADVELHGYLDYPLRGNALVAWGRHVVTAAVSFSANAKIWLAGWSGTQKALTELLADLGSDIVEQPSTDEVFEAFSTFGLRVSDRKTMLEASRQLRFTTQQEVHEVQDLRDGTSEVSFRATSGGTSVNVPEAVLVELEDEEQQLSVTLTVAVRYEVKEGRLAWTLKPMGVATVRREFRYAVAEALAGGDRTVVHGTAEAYAL